MKNARYWGRMALLWLGLVALSAVAMIIILAIFPPDPITGQRGADQWWAGAIAAVVLMALFTRVAVRVSLNAPGTSLLHTEEQIRIARPLAAVFAFLADVRNDRRWSPQIVETLVTSAEPLRVGASYRHVLLIGRRRLTVDYVVTAYDPPRHLAVKGQFGRRSIGGSYTLASDGTNTLVTMMSEMQVSPLAKPFLQLSVRLVQRQSRGTLARLRHELEQSQ